MSINDQLMGRDLEAERAERIAEDRANTVPGAHPPEHERKLKPTPETVEGGDWPDEWRFQMKTMIHDLYLATDYGMDWQRAEYERVDENAEFRKKYQIWLIHPMEYRISRPKLKTICQIWVEQDRRKAEEKKRRRTL